MLVALVVYLSFTFALLGFGELVLYVLKRSGKKKGDVYDC